MVDTDSHLSRDFDDFGDVFDDGAPKHGGHGLNPVHLGLGPGRYQIAVGTPEATGCTATLLLQHNGPTKTMVYPGANLHEQMFTPFLA
jgi:hypothetical protein